MKLIYLLFFMIILAGNVNAQFLDIEILEDYQKVQPGSKVVAGITLYLPDTERRDITITSYIKDFNDNIYSTESRVLAIETVTTIVVDLNIPEDATIGRYKFYVEAKMDGKIYSAGNSFEVLGPLDKFRVGDIAGTDKQIAIYITLLAIISSFISSLIVLFLYNRKLNKVIKQHMKADIEDLINEGAINK